MLQALKVQNNDISYSKIITALYGTSMPDISLYEINKRFFELEELIPDLHSTWETLRIIAIHVRKLPPDVRHVHIKQIDAQLADIASRVMELKKE